MTETDLISSADTVESTEPRLYEIAFLVRQEGDAATVLQLISQHGGEVTHEGQVHLLSLAYPIKHVSEAFFGFVHATLAPDAAKAIEHEVLTMQPILRLMVMRTDPIKEQQRRAPRAGVRPAAKPATGDSLTNADLEKKIEEMLA